MKIVLRPFSIKGIPADRYGVELVNGSASISLGVRDAVTALGYANHVREALRLSTGQVVELRNMQDATPADTAGRYPYTVEVWTVSDDCYIVHVGQDQAPPFFAALRQPYRRYKDAWDFAADVAQVLGQSADAVRDYPAKVA